MADLHYRCNPKVAARLAEATGFPAEWYGIDEFYIMPPPPPRRYWLFNAPPRLHELQAWKDGGNALEGADFDEYCRLRGLHDFYFFSRRVCGRQWLRFNLHGALAWAWSAPNGWQTPWGQTYDRFRMGIIARGHLKTTLLTQDFAAWRAIRDPEERILIYTQSDEFAEMILSAIKTLFEGGGTTGEFFLRLYGHLIPPESERGRRYKWDQHNLELVRQGRYTDPTIRSKGFGGRLAGSHNSVQLVDDLTAEELTRTQMEKRIRALETLTPLYHSLALGERRFVGTPWAFYDTIKYAVKHWPQALVARMPWRKPNGELIYPPIEPVKDHGGCSVPEALDAKRRNSWFFSCQYECFPKDVDKQGFNKDWFRYFRYDRGKITTLDRDGKPEKPIELNDCNVFLIIDPNTGRKPGERAAAGVEMNAPRIAKVDYAGFIILAVDPKNNWYVLRALRWRCNPDELIDKTFELVQIWQPKLVAIETTAAQILFLTLFRREWQAGRPQFILRDWGNNAGKSKIEERIKGLIPLYANGFIYHREGETVEAAKGTSALEEELEDYPTAEYDDLSDALSASLQLVYAPGDTNAEAMRAVRQYDARERKLSGLDRGSRKMAKWIMDAPNRRAKQAQDDFWYEGEAA